MFHFAAKKGTFRLILDRAASLPQLLLLLDCITVCLILATVRLKVLAQELNDILLAFTVAASREVLVQVLLHAAQVRFLSNLLHAAASLSLHMHTVTAALLHVLRVAAVSLKAWLQVAVSLIALLHTAVSQKALLHTTVSCTSERQVSASPKVMSFWQQATSHLCCWLQHAASLPHILQIVAGIKALVSEAIQTVPDFLLKA